MTEHEHEISCPECGGPLEAGKPCPNCLLKMALQPTGELDVALDDFSIPAETAELSPVGRPKNPEPDLEAVREAFPQLEIIAMIGRGGMGTVFKARQPKLDRFVALKILSAKLADKPAFAERFAQEGKLLARLSHPNIVSVYDYGEAGGFYYLILEYIDGVNLRQAMREERFSPEQALAIVPRICEALQYAHDEGVLHRDVKPENILLDTRSRIKITDFGIGKLVQTQPDADLINQSRDSHGADDADSNSDFASHGGTGDTEGDSQKLDLTQQGLVLGTPSYMAPEQREMPDQVDHRADIYSLGVVFYELLTGELPKGDFPVPSAKTPVGADVDEIVLKALQRERDKRYQSAEDMKTRIETVTAASESRAKKSELLELGMSVRVSPRFPWIVHGLFLLFFLFGFSFFGYYGGQVFHRIYEKEGLTAIVVGPALAYCFMLLVVIVFYIRFFISILRIRRKERASFPAVENIPDRKKRRNYAAWGCGLMIVWFVVFFMTAFFWLTPRRISVVGDVVKVNGKIVDMTPEEARQPSTLMLTSGFGLLSATIGLLILITWLGWKQLRQIRATGNASGWLIGMITALFCPFFLLWYVLWMVTLEIFISHFSGTFRGVMEALGGTIGTFFAILIAAGITWKTYRWVFPKPVSPARLARWGLGLNVSAATLALLTMLVIVGIFHHTIVNTYHYRQQRLEDSFANQQTQLQYRITHLERSLESSGDDAQSRQEHEKRIRSMEESENAALHHKMSQAKGELNQSFGEAKLWVGACRLIPLWASAILAVIGGVFGWCHLVKIRKTPEKPGQVPGLIAALLPLCVALIVLPASVLGVIFSLGDFGTNRDFVTGIAALFGGIFGLCVATVAVFLTIRWQLSGNRKSNDKSPPQPPVENAEPDVVSEVVPDADPDPAAAPRSVFQTLIFILLVPLLCASIFFAVWVPAGWMRNIAPVQAIKTLELQSQARMLYWQQAEETLQRYLDPDAIQPDLAFVPRSKPMPEELLPDYRALLLKYQQKFRAEQDTFRKESEELFYKTSRDDKMAVNYQGIFIQSPEKDNFLTRFKKTPYKSRFYHVLLLVTLTSALSCYLLFRWRNRKYPFAIFVVSSVSLISSVMLISLPAIYCWLGESTGYTNLKWLESLADFWGFLMFLGLTSYCITLFLIYSIFFTPKRKTFFHRTRALTALFLILFPVALAVGGNWLITKINVSLGVHHIYGILQLEEKPKLKSFYAGFYEDYMTMLEEHDVELPIDMNTIRPNTSIQFPDDVLQDVRVMLALHLKLPSVSWGDLKNWNPPQANITDPHAIGGFFAFAVIVLLGVPGLLFALLHIVRMKHDLRRKGLFIACTALFLWPVVFTLGSVPAFIIVMIQMPQSDDNFIFLFAAAFGTVGISLGVYFIRRYLRRGGKRES